MTEIIFTKYLNKQYIWKISIIISHLHHIKVFLHILHHHNHILLNCMLHHNRCSYGFLNNNIHCIKVYMLRNLYIRCYCIVFYCLINKIRIFFQEYTNSTLVVFTANVSSNISRNLPNKDILGGTIIDNTSNGTNTIE